MISIQTRFHTNISQRPILKERKTTRKILRIVNSYGGYD